MQIGQPGSSTHIPKAYLDLRLCGQTRSTMAIVPYLLVFWQNSSRSLQTSLVQSLRYKSTQNTVPKFWKNFEIRHFAALGAYIIDYVRVLVPSCVYLMQPVPITC